MSTFLFGPHSVEDALQAGRPVEVIYISEGRKKRDLEKILSIAKDSGVKIEFVPSAFFKRFESGSKIPHQGIVAKTVDLKFHEFKEWINKIDLSLNPIALLLDHIEDPHNFGAIIRTSAAFGVSGLIFPKHRNAPFGPAAERAAAGGQNHISMVRVSNIAETIVRLQEIGFWVVGCDSGDGETLQNIELNKPVALVLGAEHQGLHRLVHERCDQIVKIPISKKMESLNVSVATGIFLWEFFRRGFK